MANSLWLIIITMTTVGFGEGYPNTHLGRLVGVIACIIGMLLISLMVVSMTIASEFTPSEAKAFNIIKKIQANDQAKEKAANVLKTLFRLYKIRKVTNRDLFSKNFVLFAKLKKQTGIFKNSLR